MNDYVGEMIGYCRVSTEDQNLDRQKQAIADYAEHEFDAALADITIYQDKSTGTNTKRDGYKQMINAVETGDIDAVIANSVSRIARSIRDLERTVDRITDHGTEVHIISEGLTMKADHDDPYQNALFRLLGVFAQLEAEITQQRTREGIAIRQQNDDYHHGRAPFGFEKDDGRLIEADNYDQVCAVLDLVVKDELSKRKAAFELKTSRTTINRCLERAELYGL